SCRYHGWTYDANGDLVAALTDGPNSSLCGKKEHRVPNYPIEELDGLIWVYMGEKEAGHVYDSVPHAGEVMSGSWKWFSQWDWPINYLQVIDNDVDIIHPSVLHTTC